MLFGLESLIGGGRGFINFIRNALLRDYASVLPKEHIVVEILENVAPDAEIFDASRRLKKKGYILSKKEVPGGGPFTSVAGFRCVAP